MDAAQALADLVEIAPQIGAAAVFEGNEELLGAVGVSDWWATAVARAGTALLEGAAECAGGGGAVTQLHASLGEGDVFAVGKPGARTIVAVTAARQAPGLVFYDLKRCLASLEVKEPEPAPAPLPEAPPPPQKRRRWARKRKADDAA